MTVTFQTQLKPSDDFLVGPGGDRISRDAAVELLRRSFTVELQRERALHEYYDANEQIRTADGRHVDFLFLLAKFMHESSGGTAGMAVTTKSWGNTRPPSFGPNGIGQEPQYINGKLNGYFTKYATWLDGMKSTSARLVTPDYVYYGWGRRAIQDVYLWFDNPATPDRDESTYVWAPAGDFNNPSSYLRAIVDFMNAHMDQNQPSILFTPPEIIVDYIPRTNKNRPGDRISVDGIIWHDTGNRNVGADAWAHRMFAHNGGGKEGVSYHFTGDDKRIYVLLPYKAGEAELGYHALRGCNTHTVAYEICVNADGDWTRTLMNAAYFGWLLEQPGHLNRVLNDTQHYHCTQKNCPAKLRERNEWESFLSMIRMFGQAPPPADEPLRFDNWPYQYVLGFKGHVLKVGGAVWPDNPSLGALSVFGYPLTNEYAGVDGNSYQPTERYVLQWRPNILPPWDIVGLHWGTAIPARKDS